MFARKSQPIPAVPVDLKKAEGREALARATTYLRHAEASTNGDHLLERCTHLVCVLRLPIDRALALIREMHDPEKHFSDDKIRELLEYARNHGEDPVEDKPPPGALSKITHGQVVDILSRHPDWKGVLRFNVLTREPIAVTPPMPMRMERGVCDDGDLSKIKRWFEDQEYNVGLDAIRVAVKDVWQMKGHEYNPFVTYLDGISADDRVQSPDEKLDLDRIHETVLNSPDGPIASQIVKKQLVAAVRRMRAMPGLHDDLRPIDHRVVVVLQGEQETGKTSFLRQLGGPFYATVSGDVSDPEVRNALAGAAIVEMEEMRTQRKSDREGLKRFISATFDKDRRKYDRSAEVVQRSYVLFGTANDLAFEDPSGHARFAVIRVGKMCGEEAFMAIRDRLWAEADYLAQTDFDHHLSAEEKAWCAERTKVHEVEDTVAEQLREKLSGIPFVTVLEAYGLVYGLRFEPPSKADEMRVSESLRRIGCRREKVGQKRGWRVPAQIASQPPRADSASVLKSDETAHKIRESLATTAN